MIKKTAVLLLVSVSTFTLAAEDKNTNIERKLKIVIPKVRFKNVTAEQALDFLRRESRRQDPEGKGINIIYVKKEKSDNVPQK